MPFIGILHLLIAVGFAVHSQRTGRPQYWMFILLFVPFAGSLAYVAIELLPELASGRRARSVARDIKTLVDPDREWRERAGRVRETGTIEARLKLAEECERKGMWADAIATYSDAATGVYADDPDVLRGLARAKLGFGDATAAIAVLDRIRAVHTEYQSQDAHLTYARALEASNRLDEARGEYEALSGYFIGLEARARYGLLLQRLGDTSRARRMFEDVLKASRAKGVVILPEERQWITVAQRNLT